MSFCPLYPRPFLEGRKLRSAFDSQFAIMIVGERQKSCKDRGSSWWQRLRITVVCPRVKLVPIRLRGRAQVMSYGRFLYPRNNYNMRCWVDRDKR